MSEIYANFFIKKLAEMLGWLCQTFMFGWTPKFSVRSCTRCQVNWSGRHFGRYRHRVDISNRDKEIPMHMLSSATSWIGSGFKSLEHSFRLHCFGTSCVYVYELSLYPNKNFPSMIEQRPWNWGLFCLSCDPKSLNPISFESVSREG